MSSNLTRSTMGYKDPVKRREYARQWIAKRRSDFFLDKVCCVCGSSANLELDHIDPSQKVEHRIWSWAEERRRVEIAKCQILCESCHLDKTKKMYDERQHGTELMYDKEKCRCDSCREASRLGRAERRSRAKDSPGLKFLKGK